MRRNAKITCRLAGGWTLVWDGGDWGRTSWFDYESTRIEKLGIEEVRWIIRWKSSFGNDGKLLSSILVDWEGERIVASKVVNKELRLKFVRFKYYVSRRDEERWIGQHLGFSWTIHPTNHWKIPLSQEFERGRHLELVNRISESHCVSGGGTLVAACIVSRYEPRSGCSVHPYRNMQYLFRRTRLHSRGRNVRTEIKIRGTTRGNRGINQKYAWIETRILAEGTPTAFCRVLVLE